MNFVIEGTPKGKGRPRFSRHNGYVKTYTPLETLDYEQQVRIAYQFAEGKYYAECPLKMSVVAFFEPPKSVSKKKKQMMLDGLILPTKKPDVDNIIKVILDGLNGIAFHDDVQVVELTVNKKYSERPRTEICIDTYFDADRNKADINTEDLPF